MQYRILLFIQTSKERNKKQNKEGRHQLIPVSDALILCGEDTEAPPKEFTFNKISY